MMMRHSRDWPRFAKAFARWGSPDVEIRAAAIIFMRELLVGDAGDGVAKVRTTPTDGAMEAGVGIH